MPRETFSTAALGRALTPADAFQRGLGGARLDHTSFELLDAVLPYWRLGPKTEQRLLPLPDAEDAVMSVAETMEWLSGPLKGDADVHELQQELLREPEPLATPDFFHSGPVTDFGRQMRTNNRAHDLIDETNNTALTSASWMHQMMLMEYLEKAAMRRSFASASRPRQLQNMQFFTGPQQLRVFYRMLRAGLAPAPRRA